MTRTLPILFLLLPLAAPAQQAVVLLDPARGGADSGARIADGVPEKQVTLDLAGRLASLLRARGFTVQMTREADVDLSSDARAALANNTHPLACILLYAAPGGSGVHLYTSALKRKDAAGTAVRWDEAQAPFADRSRTLAADLRTAMDHGRVTASVGQTWMRPLDNMQCPAVAVELLPEKKGTDASDSSYQSHVANAVANTLLQWRAAVAAATPPAPVPQPPAQKPVPQPAQSAEDQPARSAPASAPTGTSAEPGEPKLSDAPSSVNPTKPSAVTKPSTPATPAPSGSAAGSSEAAPRRTQAVPRSATPAPIVRQTPAQPAPAQPDRTEP